MTWLTSFLYSSVAFLNIFNEIYNCMKLYCITSSRYELGYIDINWLVVNLPMGSNFCCYLDTLVKKGGRGGGRATAVTFALPGNPITWSLKVSVTGYFNWASNPSPALPTWEISLKSRVGVKRKKSCSAIEVVMAKKIGTCAVLWNFQPSRAYRRRFESWLGRLTFLSWRTHGINFDILELE